VTVGIHWETGLAACQKLDGVRGGLRFVFKVVPAAGLEPARLAAGDFKFLAYQTKSIASPRKFRGTKGERTMIVGNGG